MARGAASVLTGTLIIEFGVTALTHTSLAAEFESLAREAPSLAICSVPTTGSGSFSLGPTEAGECDKTLFRQLALDAVGQLGIEGPGTAAEILMRHIVQEMPHLQAETPMGMGKIDATLRSNFGLPVVVIPNAAMAAALMLRAELEQPERQGQDIDTELSSVGDGGVLGARSKPDGWTKKELVNQARAIARVGSNSTFDRIRRHAGIPPAIRGGVGQQKCFSVADLKRLATAAEEGPFRMGSKIAAAWRELLP